MAIFLRNWHLKLGAVFLATVLYTGLVFSGSFTELTMAGVAVSAVGQPAQPQTVLMSTLPVVDVRYRVARELASMVTPDTFSATVDLSAYDLDNPAQPQSLPISVASLVAGVDVLGFEPQVATVRLDAFATKEIPVRVDRGTVPPGLDVRTPQIEPRQVEVRGPATIIAQVDYARARVRIDPSGIDVEDSFDLDPVDVEGRIVTGPIELDPSRAAIRIDVLTVETNKTVAVRPDLRGTPAAGFGIGQVTVDPAVVTLRGHPDALRAINEVVTAELSAAGANEDLSFDAALILPEGTRLTEPLEAVAVSVAIEPLVSSRTFVVGLVCQGAPAGSACLPALGQVSVTLSGPTATLAGLSGAAITPIVNVSGRGPGTHTVSLTLPSLPARVNLIAISPTQVSVRIVPPATPTPSP